MRHLLQCLVTYDVHKLHHIVTNSNGCVFYHSEYVVCRVNPNKNMYLSKKLCVLWRPRDHIIPLRFQTALALSVIKFVYLSFCHEGKWEKQQRAINFDDWLFWCLPRCTWKQIVYTSEVFFVPKTVFYKNSWKISKKLLVTESDFRTLKVQLCYTLQLCYTQITPKIYK